MGEWIIYMTYSWNGILFIIKKEEPTDMYNNMIKFQTHYVEQKRTHTNMPILWFQLYGVQEQKIWADSDRSQKVGRRVVELIAKWHKGNLGANGNVLSLTLSSGYTGV